ncbi:MAG: hypothetical protein VX438_12200 [Planctomycetota bacterium]|nr:hypothetical protein [Planctomycetota bacterium]
MSAAKLDTGEVPCRDGGEPVCEESRNWAIPGVPGMKQRGGDLGKRVIFRFQPLMPCYRVKQLDAWIVVTGTR